MKIFSATYQDFVRFDVKPNEDAFLISEKFPIFAVADGVTQSHYPNGRYALPYGAKEAANIFCEAIIDYLENNLDFKKADEKEIKNAIKEAFNFTNQKIRELNEKHSIQKRMDYKEHDWFDTVGVVAIVVSKILYYGFVGDCGLAIFDKNNKKKFQTEDMVQPAVKRFKTMYPDSDVWDPLQRQFLIRKDFRNNPDKRIGYGSFTGQLGVENYYALGKRKLTKGDMVVLYSDGFFELMKHPDFLGTLRSGKKNTLDSFGMKKAKENHKKYGDDRTFVAATI